MLSHVSRRRKCREKITNGNAQLDTILVRSIIKNHSANIFKKATNDVLNYSYGFCQLSRSRTVSVFYVL